LSVVRIQHGSPTRCRFFTHHVVPLLVHSKKEPELLVPFVYHDVYFLHNNKAKECHHPFPRAKQSKERRREGKESVSGSLHFTSLDLYPRSPNLLGLFWCFAYVEVLYVSVLIEYVLDAVLQGFHCSEFVQLVHLHKGRQVLAHRTIKPPRSHHDTQCSVFSVQCSN